MISVADPARSLFAAPRLLARGGLRVAGTLAESLHLGLRAGPELQALPPADRTRAQARLLHGAAEEVTRLHGVRLATRGRPSSDPVLYLANHVSWLDPLLVAARAPLLPVAKAEVAAWPVVGRALRALGVLFVSRGDALSGAVLMRRVLFTLAAGVSVLIFPEGTTSDGRGLAPFQRGIFELAHRRGLTVLPVALGYGSRELHWFGDQLFVPHYLRQAASAHIDARVCFGHPIPAARFSSPASVAAAVRFELRELGLGGARRGPPA